MKLGWSALDGVSADRLWLRPSGLISGRAAAEAIASGQARPLTFNLSPQTSSPSPPG